MERYFLGRQISTLCITNMDFILLHVTPCCLHLQILPRPRIFHITLFHVGKERYRLNTRHLLKVRTCFPLLRNSPIPLSSYPFDLLAPYFLPSILPSSPGLSSVQCFSLIPLALFNQARSYHVPWIGRWAIAIVSLAVFAAFRHRFSTSHSFHLT